MDTKVTTVIVNAMKQGLTMRVGLGQYYAKLASIKQGAEYRMQLDVNWTYQEFMLQDKSNIPGHQLFLNSDDCCHYERITIQENADGTLHLHTQQRKQFGTGREPCTAIPEVEETAVHPKLLHVIMSSWKAWLRQFL